jgi:hypothetical protein
MLIQEIFNPAVPPAEDPNTSELRLTVSDTDTEMQETSFKQEHLTPCASPRRDDASHAVSNTIKCEEIKIKSEPGKSETSDPAPLSLELLVDEEGKKEKPKKPRRVPAKTAREYHQRKQQDSTVSGQKGIRLRLRLANTRRTANPEKLLHSISHYDFVSTYNAGPSNGAGPTLKVTSKKDFMQEILSSCPEVDLQKFRTELSILGENSRSFGFRRMEMKNGMWLLKGMKSCKF